MRGTSGREWCVEWCCHYFSASSIEKTVLNGDAHFRFSERDGARIEMRLTSPSFGMVRTKVVRLL